MATVKIEVSVILELNDIEARALEKLLGSISKINCINKDITEEGADALRALWGQLSTIKE